MQGTQNAVINPAVLDFLISHLYHLNMNIFIMRHGQTDWNRQGRLQGRSDVPLAETGIAQAEKTRDGLKKLGLSFDKVYSSPLARALQTAEIVSGFPEERIIKDSRIVEINFGGAEGKSIKEIYSNPDFAWIVDFFEEPESYRAKDGAESFEQILSRTADFWRNEIKNLEGRAENILVATHGGTLESLLLFIDGRSLSQYWDVKFSNCSVNLVTLKDGEFAEEWTGRTFY